MVNRLIFFFLVIRRRPPSTHRYTLFPYTTLFRSTQGFAIVVDGLRKRYGNLVAVDGISFRVKEREIFGLLGPNGAGKTTTVEILEGLRQADAGRAVVAGIDVLKTPQKVKSRIGVQLQASAF